MASPSRHRCVQAIQSRGVAYTATSENSVPAETQAAFTTLGVNKVIFVQRGNIGSAVESSLPSIQTNLKNMQEVVNNIKDYSQSENYITITSLKTGEGFFAPASMLAAYHRVFTVLRIEDAPENPAAIANKIDTFRLWKGDYYHGNRAPGYLPKYTEDIEQMNPSDLLAAILKYLSDPSNPLPPWGLDADRFWNADLHDAIESYIQGLGLR